MWRRLPSLLTVYAELALMAAVARPIWHRALSSASRPTSHLLDLRAVPDYYLVSGGSIKCRTFI